MNLRILSTAAALALVLPLAAPTATFAQSRLGSILSATGNAGAGGGGGPVVGGGGGGGAPVAGGGGWRGGGGGGGWSGHHHRHGGFYPGVIGGAYASSYYGSGYYGSYGPSYYDDQYYDDSVVAVAPGGDDVAYCRQKYRSYDVRTGTYLGFDGQRHPCP